MGSPPRRSERPNTRVAKRDCVWHILWALLLFLCHCFEQWLLSANWLKGFFFTNSWGWLGSCCGQRMCQTSCQNACMSSRHQVELVVEAEGGHIAEKAIREIPSILHSCHSKVARFFWSGGFRCRTRSTCASAAHPSGLRSVPAWVTDLAASLQDCNRFRREIWTVMDPWVSLEPLGTGCASSCKVGTPECNLCTQDQWRCGNWRWLTEKRLN